MGASDLRVTVDSAKLRCVLDPALVLCHPLGARLALRLTRAFETWLTRSFWQVIDASELLQHAAPGALAAPQPDPQALSEWIGLRDSTDAGSWLLRWVGDLLAESQLPPRSDEDLVERFEWLAAGLAARDDGAGIDGRTGWCRGFDPLLSVRDAIALSATLEGALILSPQPAAAAEPWPVQALARLGVPVGQVAGDDPDSLFAAERGIVREALAGAGLAALLQSMAPLAVVHVLAGPDAAQADSADQPADPWCQARAWWYRV